MAPGLAPDRGLSLSETLAECCGVVRAFVRKFGLRNYDEWREYAKSGDKPHDIPYDPYNAYAETAPHSL
jgi:hypothetical protein